MVKKKYDFPIVITNNENLFALNSKNYYSMRIDFMNKFNINNPDSNSGLMIYSYTVWLSSIFDNIKECQIFGLDAGEGGRKYFSGKSTLPNHVAMRDKNKQEMGDFILKCQEVFPIIKNYSYFHNNTENK